MWVMFDPTWLPAKSAFTSCAIICSFTLPTKSLCSCSQFFMGGAIRESWPRFCASAKSNAPLSSCRPGKSTSRLPAAFRDQLHRWLTDEDLAVKLLAPT
jgi:hypothetical protein